MACSELAAFLNEYMRIHREPDEEFLVAKRKLFARTIHVVGKSVLADRSPGRLGLSVMEATLVGIALNLDTLEKLPDHAIRSMYNRLLQSEAFSEEKLKEGLAGTQRVRGRISTAVRIFSGSSNG